ncbi:MAG: WhiB family transcriptional regulator, redox-sensing transcriptional regulator [Actinomycetota bacterium]|nr:WhiB family transcriptional regulator, redox-sensing transcriptional regulator [Actinomycetota bacterium]
MFAQQEAVVIEELAPEIDWSRARCRDGAATMTALFFSEQLDDIARAKQICTKCPLIEECLAGALARREPWGVWGGQLFQNGKVLAFKRKRGRPPKNPTERDQLTA